MTDRRNAEDKVAKAADALRALRGKVRLNLDLKELRRDRRTHRMPTGTGGPRAGNRRRAGV